jgi:ketosteroid isomerase-like protein
VKHPNVELLERLFDAFGRDPLAVARAIADDAVWTVPGANAMTGSYRGRDEILQFLRRTGTMTDGTYRVVLLYVLADDDRAVAVYHARGERGGRTLDIDQALFCQVRDGQLARIEAVPFDPVAFDAFWA